MNEKREEHMQEIEKLPECIYFDELSKGGVMFRHQNDRAFAFVLLYCFKKNWTHLSAFLGEMNACSYSLTHVSERLAQDDQAYKKNQAIRYYLWDGIYFAGSIQVIRHPEQVAQITGWIDKAYERQGWMNAALKALEPHLYDAGFKKIFCELNSTCDRGIKTLKTLGYKKEEPQYCGTTRLIKKRPMTHILTRCLERCFE